MTNTVHKLIRKFSVLVVWVLMPVVVMAQDDPLNDRATLRRLMSVFDYLDGQVDHSVYEVSALSSRLGNDPKVMQPYVQNSFAYRPYWGALKGAQGVLFDRTGNALDRSLLLAELLAMQGHAVRIAGAQLSDEQTQDLLNLAQLPIPVAPESVNISAEMISVMLNQGGLNEEDLRRQTDEQQVGAQTRRETLNGQYAAFEQAVQNDLSHFPEFLSGRGANLNATAIAAEYYWVEVQDENNNWQTLDALPFDFAAQLATLEGVTRFDVTDLPEILEHAVLVEVIATTDHPTEPETTVMSTKLTARVGMMQPLVMSATPVHETPSDGGLGVLTPMSAPPSATLFQMRSGGNLVVEALVSDAGVVTDPNPPKGNATAGGFGGLGTALEGMFDTDPEPTTPENTQKLLELKLVYTVRNSQGLQPEGKTRRFERLIVPHGGHAGGAHKDVGFESPWIAQLSLVPFVMTGDLFDHSAMVSQFDSSRQILSLLQARNVGSEPIENRFGALTSLAHQTAMNAWLLATDAGTKQGYYSDQMAVIVEEGGVFGTASKPVMTSSIDLMQISGHHSSASGGGHGLEWTLAETAVLARQSGGTSQGFVPAFETLSQGGGTSVYALKDAERIARFGGDAIPDLTAELNNGFDLVAMSHWTNPIWFSRDPDNGLVIGRVPGGRGDALVESGTSTALIAEEATVSYEGFIIAMDITLVHLELTLCFMKTDAIDSEKEFEKWSAAMNACTAGYILGLIGAVNPIAALLVFPFQIGYCAYGGTSGGRCVVEAAASKGALYSSMMGGRKAFVAAAAINIFKTGLSLSDLQ